MEMKLVRDGQPLQGLFKGGPEDMKKGIIEMTTHPGLKGRSELVLYGTIEEFGEFLK